LAANDRREGREITESIARAEAKFLKSLRAEAARSTQTQRRARVIQVPRARSGASRARGKSMGDGFARLNGHDWRAGESFEAAIKQGFNEACARDEVTAALSQNSDFLRSMGFDGHDDDA
jgi:hypothetical protein